MGCARAFTLIELLVVISIIAMLNGIMVPVLAASKDSARSAICMSNLQQQGVAWEAAMVDDKGRIPRTAGLAGWVRGRDRWWHNLLADYITPGKINGGSATADEEHVICPEFKKDSSGQWIGQIWNAYAVNVRWTPGSAAGDNELQSWHTVRSPSLYPWIGDPVYKYHPSGVWQNRMRLGYLNVWQNLSGPDLDMPGWGLGFNHQGVGYAVFADAHVESVDESNFKAVNSDGVPDWFFNR